MGKSQRTKGAGFEREVVTALRAAGIGADRNLNQTRDGGGDISLPSYLIECKRRARISVYEWLEQAEEACSDDQDPIVVARADRKDAIAIMPFEVLLRLLNGR